MLFLAFAVFPELKGTTYWHFSNGETLQRLCALQYTKYFCEKKP